MTKAVLFDFDNTLAYTDPLTDIRESADYDSLTPERLSEAKLYQPVRHLLSNLKAAGISLGIVTNGGKKYIFTLLEHLEIYDFFDVIISYADVRQAGAKPNPDGIDKALAYLQIPTERRREVPFIGDDYRDIIAAYRAGVIPILPTWASRSPVSIPPAIELSSADVEKYVNNPREFRLFAERCAHHEGVNFQRQMAYFLPLDRSGNVVTCKEEMAIFCLGRYFSQKNATTASYHEAHALSRDIYEKEKVKDFELKPYWWSLVAKVIAAIESYNKEDIDLITIIPAKPGRPKRLEKLLERVGEILERYYPGRWKFEEAIFSFSPDAESQKTLRRDERAQEIRRTLSLTGGAEGKIESTKILVIDDVITTGATLSVSLGLLENAGAKRCVGLAIAKTVSVTSEEKECPKCNRPMVIRTGRETGIHFWGCTGYGDENDPCDFTESLEDRECPRCGRALRKQRNRRTDELFWSCTGYNKEPSCNYSEPDQ